MFGVINRREDIEEVVQTLGEIAREANKELVLSIRFLISFMLEMANVELRNRILFYLTQVFAVPLLYPSQFNYLGHITVYRYVPEVLFNMDEGLGLLNFGVGSNCALPSGKSQLLNDIIFPQRQDHHPFNEVDNSPFSYGQVDAFFEKSFQTKHKVVYMDGQGSITEETLENCLSLTNIVLVQFSANDLNYDE